MCSRQTGGETGQNPAGAGTEAHAADAGAGQESGNLFGHLRKYDSAGRMECGLRAEYCGGLSIAFAVTSFRRTEDHDFTHGISE